MNSPLYTKLFQRALPLIHVQAWYWGEKSDPRQWTQKSQPFSPYIVFERSDKVVTVFFDPRGIRWVKEKLLDQSRQNEQFTSQVVNTFKGKISEIQEILRADQALSKEQLSVFVRQVRDAWPWFEAVWWLVDAFEELKRQDEGMFAQLQDARKFGELFFPNSCSVIRKSVEEAYPSFKPFADVILLDEFCSGRLPSAKQLKQRFKHFVFTDDRLFETESLREIEEKYGFEAEKSDAMQTTEFKGQCAFAGKVRGRVRKIIDRSQNRLFEDGEILVSPSTLPDFLPAMQKAAAIVSDEGGLISHAAIVARELKKPCVIGTKHAFDLLKDGDLVEVDAGNGIVRKIR